MTHTILLTTVIVNKWTVDLNKENVTIYYQVLDTNGVAWITDFAILWRNIPEIRDPDGNILPTPDAWYQLPTEYLPILNSLSQDAITAITARILG